jgi:PII-like signaling protein
MNIPKDAVLLRIFFGEDDRFEHQPLYEAIVLKAREMHLAGATVLRGPMGFGHSSHLHTAKILRLSFDLPIVVEIVDTEMKIQAFLPVLDGMMASGLITMEEVQVLQYGKEGLRESRSLLGVQTSKSGMNYNHGRARASGSSQ